MLLMYNCSVVISELRCCGGVGVHGAFIFMMRDDAYVCMTRDDVYVCMMRDGAYVFAAGSSCIRRCAQVAAGDTSFDSRAPFV